MALHHYLVFGLRVVSSRPISSLLVPDAPFAGEADVEIVEGEVQLPDSAQVVDGIAVSVEGESCCLGIEECGRFEVHGGRKIVVDPDPAATPEQVNLYLLGSVFGALLHQRRLLPFHCNAVEIDGSVFLFCGDSGAGKSTMAAHFVDRGFRLLTDDLCALDFDSEGRLIASSGVGRLKLWQDTLGMLGRSTAGLELVPWYDNKFEVPLAGEALEEPLAVVGIYHLRTAENGRSPGIHPLKGLEAVNAVTANIYRRRLGDVLGATARYLAATSRIVEQVPIFSLNRQWGFRHFQDHAVAAEQHMHELTGIMRRLGHHTPGPNGPRTQVRG